MTSRNVQDQAKRLLAIASAAQPQFSTDGDFLRIVQNGNQFSVFKQPRQQLSSSTIRNR